MFELSAPYYDKFYSFLDYREASQNLKGVMTEYHPAAISLLDIACGTGRYLEYLQPDFRCAGLDILPGLLEQAEKRCPGIPFHQGDMRAFAIGEKFDVVTCLFCSIGYLLELDDVKKAIGCMAGHLNAGGVLILEPWISPDQCWTGRVTCDVFDEPDLKIVRMYTHEREGEMSVYNVHNLVQRSDMRANLRVRRKTRGRHRT